MKIGVFTGPDTLEVDGAILRFTHTADAAARIVLRNALFLGRNRVSFLVVPWCTYTSPEVAHVGSTEGDPIRVDLSDVAVTHANHTLISRQVALTGKILLSWLRTRREERRDVGYRDRLHRSSFSASSHDPIPLKR